MDWYKLATDVLEQSRKQNNEDKNSFTTKILAESFEADGIGNGKLSPLEAAGISVLLETASLQLYIIDVGTCSFSSEDSNSEARQNIAEVLEETEKEILEKGTFNILYEKTKQEVEKNNAFKLIPETLLQNQAKILDLKMKLDGQEQKKIEELNKKQEIIACLKDKIHEEITKNDVKLRYVDRWETARQNQHKIKCLNAESELEQKLKQTNYNINKEIRVHKENTTFLSLEIENLNEELEKWKNNYKSEMDKRIEKIKLLQKRKAKQDNFLEDLKKLYEERKNEINEYLDFKEKLQKEQEHEEYLNRMATKIQAWWRGTMVRRGLGPYKKKKKPTKDKKGKKK